MTERLAIVGASVRAAAASAVRAGFQVTAADLFADDDLRSIAVATRIDNYPHGFVDWLRSLEPKPSAWMYTGALENHPALVDQMAALAPLWGNGGEVLLQVRSPWKLADALQQAGLLFPEIRRSPDGLPRDGSWLVKTGRGASGSGVRVFFETKRQGDKETRRRSKSPGSSSSPCLFYQQRVSGIPCSAVYVAAGGKSMLLGIVRQLVGEKWLAAREFQYCGAIGPWPVADTARCEIQRIGDALAERFGLIGLFGVDLVLDGERVWTIEINPRYTASTEIVERTTGLFAIEAHALACRESTLTARIVNVECPTHGKAVYFAKRTLTIVAPTSIGATVASHASRWPTSADISPAGTHIEAGHPLVTLFAEGASPEIVLAKLRDHVATMECELYAQ